jgi:hypothetical protein
MSDEGKAEGHDVEYDIDHGLDVLPHLRPA